MKKHFAKAIHTGSRSDYGGRGKIDYRNVEDAPQREKIVYGRTKHCRTTYNSVQNFLRSRVGKSWDSIYSEISQSVSKKTKAGEEFHTALRWSVEFNTKIVDGRAVKSDGEELNATYRACDFYICPKTKTLKKTPKKTTVKYRSNRDSVSLDIDDNRQYHKIDNIWYEVFLAPIPERGRWYDAAYHEIFCKDGNMVEGDQPYLATRLERIYGKRRYAVHCIRLNKREMQKLKLDEQYLAYKKKWGL